MFQQQPGDPHRDHWERGSGLEAVALDELLRQLGTVVAERSGGLTPQGLSNVAWVAWLGPVGTCWEGLIGTCWETIPKAKSWWKIHDSWESSPFSKAILVITRGKHSKSYWKWLIDRWCTHEKWWGHPQYGGFFRLGSNIIMIIMVGNSVSECKKMVTNGDSWWLMHVYPLAL